MDDEGYRNVHGCALERIGASVVACVTPCRQTRAQLPAFEGVRAERGGLAVDMQSIRNRVVINRDAPGRLDRRPTAVGLGSRVAGGRTVAGRRGARRCVVGAVGSGASAEGDPRVHHLMAGLCKGPGVGYSLRLRAPRTSVRCPNPDVQPRPGTSRRFERCCGPARAGRADGRRRRRTQSFSAPAEGARVHCGPAGTAGPRCPESATHHDHIFILITRLARTGSRLRRGCRRSAGLRIGLGRARDPGGVRHGGYGTVLGAPAQGFWHSPSLGRTVGSAAPAPGWARRGRAGLRSLR